jgi:hypothetical protein
MLDERRLRMSSFLYFGLAPSSLVGVSLLINNDVYMIFTHSERIFKILANFPLQKLCHNGIDILRIHWKEIRS